MPEYSLTPKAETDLEGIWLYSVEHWGVEQADCYIDDLDGAFQLLAGQPHLCRERREYTPPVRIHHCASHLIIYTTNSQGIEIIRILHEPMEVNEQLT